MSNPTALRVSLPTWDDCKKAVDGGYATHLQHFIYHNEPSDTDTEGFQTEAEFREQLANLIAYERQGPAPIPQSSKAVTLPGWMECSEKDERGEPLSALERFILDNEPAGLGEEVAFLTGLAAVIKEERERGVHETNGEPDLAMDRKGPYCNEHEIDVRAWCVECLQCTAERKRDAGSRPDELVTRRIAPSEIAKRGALIEELTEIGHKLADDRGNRVPPAVTTVMQVQDLARRLADESAVKSSEQPSAPASPPLSKSASSTDEAGAGLTVSKPAQHIPGALRCEKHGVTFAFDGDTCWACQEERNAPINS